MQKPGRTAQVTLRRGSADLSRRSGSSLAGRERGGRNERGETGGTRLRSWALVEPRDNPVHIDRHGRRDVLHVGLLEAPIAGPSQPKGPDALREGPFDPRAACIVLLPGGTGLPRPRRV